MDTKQKAIDGLTRCAAEGDEVCKDCPYYSEGSCASHMAKDVLQEFGDVIINGGKQRESELDRYTILEVVSRALEKGNQYIMIYTHNGENNVTIYPDGKLDINEIGTWLQKRFPNDPPNYWEQEIRNALDRGEFE